MKIKQFLLVVVLLTASRAFAQNTGDTLGKPVKDQKLGIPVTRLYNPWRSNVPVWLNLSAGANFADCFDKGTVPFRYTGFGANVDAGVTVIWGRCRFQAEGKGFYTSLASLGGAAYDIKALAEFLYHCDIAERLGFWAGGTLQGFVDIKEIPALMNAATSVSMFGNLCATAKVDFPFAYLHDGRNLLTATAKVSLPIVGVVNRPGYAYIGNPSINQETFFEDTETFAKFLPGASTELGLYLNLPNDNRIGLSYQWDYFSTGKKGTYRYDHALHSINLSFVFRVN